MKKFIVCVQNDTFTSYSCKIINRELYSIEELSYFIYENIHLIDENILDEDLFSFVEDKVKLNLRGKSLCEVIVAILESNNFYDTDDINLIKSIIQNYKTGDLVTRAKMIGDKYLINEDYSLAIKHYDSIIKKLETHGQYGDFLYSVKFNKGVALARKLEFRDAFLIFDHLSFTMDNNTDAILYRYLSLKYYDKKRYDYEYKYIAKDVKEKLDNIDENNNKDRLEYPLFNNRLMLIVDDVIENWKKQLCDDYCE